MQKCLSMLPLVSAELHSASSGTLILAKRKPSVISLFLHLHMRRWNHSAVGVFAVPHWKVFVFGGNSGNLAEGGNPQVGVCVSLVRCLQIEKREDRSVRWRNGPSFTSVLSSTH